MENDKITSPYAAELRRQAEARLKEPGAQDLTPSTEQDTQRLVHELQINKIELQMQNDELSRSQAELEASLERYANLYDFAPVSYFTLDRNGTIRSANLTGAKLLRLERSRLVNMRFGLLVSPETRPIFNAFLKSVYEIHTKQTCELFLLTEGNAPIYVRIDADISSDGEDCRVTVVDITEHKQMEDLLQARLRLSEYPATGSIDKLLQQTLDEAELLTGSVIGFFHFVDSDESTLQLQTWSTNTLKNMCSAEGKGRHYAVKEAGVWVDALIQRRPVIHNDYASLPHRKGLPEGHSQVVRELVVPIIQDGIIVAILGVGNKTLDYDNRDIEMISSLADLAWDVIRRKRAEEALRAGEERFHGFFENRASGTAITSPTMGWMHANDKLCEMLGYSREELSQMTWAQLTHPDDLAPDAAQFERLLDGEIDGYSLDKRFVRKDGTTIFALLSVDCIREADHSLKYAMATILDITERKKLEMDMERMQAILSEGQRISHIGSFEYLADTQETIWSAEEFRIYGFEPASQSPVYAELLEKCIHPDDAALLDQTFRRALRDGSVYEMEHRIVRPEGTVRIVHDLANPYFDDEGKLVKYIGTTLDITERKIAEDALCREQEFIRALLESMVDGVVACDAEGQLVLLNRVAREWHGLDPIKMPQKEWASQYGLYLEDGVTPMDENAIPLVRAFGGEIVLNLRMVIRAKEQPPRHILSNCAPFFGKDGRRLGAVAVMHDVTWRKLAENALRLHTAVMETVAEGIFLIGAEDNIIKWTNRKLDELFGYERGEMVGMHVDKVNAPTEITPTQTRISIVDVLTEQGEWHGEVKNIKKDGTAFWSHIHVSLFEHPEYGRVMVSAHTDITERKQIEEVKRQFYRETIKNVTQGKLDLVPFEDVKEYLDSAEFMANVATAADTQFARHEISAFAASRGLAGDRFALFETAVGEAITNAIKHAKNCRVCTGVRGNFIWVATSDTGPGISTLTLPGATLRRGFSTMASLGMGYSIMMEACDELMLCTGPQGTTVVLLLGLVASETILTLDGLKDTWDEIPDV